MTFETFIANQQDPFTPTQEANFKEFLKEVAYQWADKNDVTFADVKPVVSYNYQEDEVRCAIFHQSPTGTWFVTERLVSGATFAKTLLPEHASSFASVHSCVFENSYMKRFDPLHLLICRK